jgi:hypothetical protein
MAPVRGVAATAAPWPAWHLAALAAAVLLYTFGLSWAPVHLHFDEIKFA